MVHPRFARTGARSLLALAALALSALVAAGCAAKSADTPPSQALGTPDPSTTATDEPVADQTQPPQQGGGGGGGGGATPPPPSWPTPEDCISYNPSNLTVGFAGGMYVVHDGSKTVVSVPGQSGDNTGEKALALAKRYKSHCFIGRNNTRTEERGAYIFDYWRNTSGQKPTIADQEEDCSPYNRNNLTVEDMGDGHGWRVKDHDHVLHLFDNGTDARNGKLVLAKYSQICFIGTSDEQDLVSYSL